MIPCIEFTIVIWSKSPIILGINIMCIVRIKITPFPAHVTRIMRRQSLYVKCRQLSG